MIRLLLNDIAFKARKPRASGDDPGDYANAIAGIK